MPRRLIINADDFGLTIGVNRAVEDLFRAGVLTSTTLMARGAAFEDAVERARRNPGLGVGCHVVLTDGDPVSDPATIPSLIGSDGQSFRATLGGFVRAVLFGRIREADVRREAVAQIARLQAAGIFVTHLDTHKHTHLFPVVVRGLCAAAVECGVPAIRNPFEQRWSLRLRHGKLPRRIQVHLLRLLRPLFARSLASCRPAVTTSDGTLGISATGDLDPASLRDLLAALPEGTWELVCHPGYNDPDLAVIRTRLREHREVERAALLEAVPEALSRTSAPQLIHYGAIAAGNSERDPPVSSNV